MISYAYLVEDIFHQITNCPHCSSSNFIKYGGYNNIPRFKCKNCERTFSIRTNTPWYYSKKTNIQWKTFCIFLMECKSLKYCSQQLKINIATAFYWRHKILKSLKSITDTNVLSDKIFMHHCFVKESFKGLKNPPFEPREKLWIVLSYDSSDNCLTLPYARRRWSKENFQKIIYSKIAPKSHIQTLGNHYIKVFIAKHNEKLGYSINHYIENPNLGLLFIFNRIMKKTRGIATKYLLQYFALVKVHFMNRKFNMNTILNTNYDSHGYIKSYDIKGLKSFA